MWILALTLIGFLIWMIWLFGFKEEPDYPYMLGLKTGDNEEEIYNPIQRKEDKVTQDYQSQRDILKQALEDAQLIKETAMEQVKVHMYPFELDDVQRSFIENHLLTWLQSHNQVHAYPKYTEGHGTLLEVLKRGRYGYEEQIIMNKLRKEYKQWMSK